LYFIDEQVGSFALAGERKRGLLFSEQLDVAAGGAANNNLASEKA
jgi:hypothetical protein